VGPGFFVSNDSKRGGFLSQCASECFRCRVFAEFQVGQGGLLEGRIYPYSAGEVAYHAVCVVEAGGSYGSTVVGNSEVAVFAGSLVKGSKAVLIVLVQKLGKPLV